MIHTCLVSRGPRFLYSCDITEGGREGKIAQLGNNVLALACYKMGMQVFSCELLNIANYQLVYIHTYHGN